MREREGKGDATEQGKINDTQYHLYNIKWSKFKTRKLCLLALRDQFVCHIRHTNWSLRSNRHSYRYFTYCDLLIECGRRKNRSIAGTW